jgi:hypothetical protein
MSEPQLGILQSGLTGLIDLKGLTITAAIAATATAAAAKTAATATAKTTTPVTAAAATTARAATRAATHAATAATARATTALTLLALLALRLTLTGKCIRANVAKRGLHWIGLGLLISSTLSRAGIAAVVVATRRAACRSAIATRPTRAANSRAGTTGITAIVITALIASIPRRIARVVARFVTRRCTRRVTWGIAARLWRLKLMRIMRLVGL